MSIIEKQEIVLKGNELGWLIKLAESHYMSQEFQGWLSKRNTPHLYEFLNELMSRFNPNNFYAGRSNELWLLTNDFSKQTMTVDDVHDRNQPIGHSPIYDIKEEEDGSET